MIDWPNGPKKIQYLVGQKTWDEKRTVNSNDNHKMRV